MQPQPERCFVAIHWGTIMGFTKQSGETSPVLKSHKPGMSSPCQSHSAERERITHPLNSRNTAWKWKGLIKTKQWVFNWKTTEIANWSFRKRSWLVKSFSFLEGRWWGSKWAKNWHESSAHRANPIHQCQNRWQVDKSVWYICTMQYPPIKREEILTMWWNTNEF